MSMPTWMKFLGEALPVFGDWLGWVIGMKDEEWEDISQAWPAPTRTRVAKLRYEVKKHAAFFGEEDDSE